MRILVIAPVWPAASELWMHRMLEHMKDHTIGFATFAPQKQFVADSIPTFDLLPPWVGALRRYNVTSMSGGIGSRRLLNVLNEHRVDKVFCHYATTAVHFKRVWQKSDCPVFVHCHGYDVTWSKSKRGRHGAAYQARLRDLASRVTFLSNSAFTKQRMADVGIPEKRIIVKHIGVPIPEKPTDRSGRGAQVNILYLGRLVDFKGPDLTIRAFEWACRHGLEGRLTIAGAGPMMEQCFALKNQSDFAERIDILGVVDPVQASHLRSKADIFTAHNCLGVKSNQEEAYGVAFVEAMADSLPVVTGASGGVCETVLHESTGVLVTPGDIEAHGRAFIRFAQNRRDRERFGEAGRARAQLCFSIDQERHQLREVFGIPELCS